MSVRTWCGRTRLEDGDAYDKFMIEGAAPDYRSVERLNKLFFTRRDEGDMSHFLLIAAWKSLDAVKNFAGQDPSKAKYSPEDDRYLLE